MPQTYLVLVSKAEELCGVEAFSRLLAQALGERAETLALDGDVIGFTQALRRRDTVVFNFPIVAWKKRLFAPVLAALTARVMGRRVITVLHEWLALDWKRRVVLLPVVLLSNRLVFSAPEIAAEFKGTRLSGLVTRDRVVIPIPPNIAPDVTPRATSHSDRLEGWGRGGRMILGQFGSIYPKKQSGLVLDVAAELVAAGHDVGVVFAGSFIKGMDDVEAEFFAKVDALGLRERVLVTGFVAGDDELAGIFEAVDVFCYIFAEGLTARRGSVLAAALSGKPVVVNAPEHDDALEHHRLFARLIEAGFIRLVPLKADTKTVAEAVVAAKSSAPNALSAEAEIATLWQDIVLRIDGPHTR